MDETTAPALSDPHPTTDPGGFTRTGVGIGQIIISVLGGLMWLYLSLGVAMCTDAGPSAQCDHIASIWSAFGQFVLLNAAAGFGLIMTGQCRPGSRWRAAATWVSVGSAVALTVAGLALLVMASQPLH